MGLLITITGFVLLLFLALVLKKSLLVSAGITLFFTLVISSLFSYVSMLDIIQSGIHGIITAIEISLLIFGALSFYNYLKAGDFLKQLQYSVLQFSTNKLVVTILLVLFFGSFLEGISGFGTPAMIIAPLLLILGFPPYLAAALPLLANTVPVIFGAVGTPVKIGFADLPVGNLPVYATVLMLLPVLALPVIFKRLLSKNNLLPSTESKAKNNRIALSAGAAFGLPFILFSFLGPEFPTLLASLIGLIFWLIYIKKLKLSDTIVKTKTLKQFFQTFQPYLLIAILLLAGKLMLQNERFVITWSAIQLEKNIAFFQPGLFFIGGILILFYFSKTKAPASLKRIFSETLLTLPAVIGTISCLAVLARLLSQNLTVTQFIDDASVLPQFAFYAAAILTGMLGSFMTGSATMSNLLFGTQWYQIGLQYQLPLCLLLACQLAGAAIGNAISLQNIVMVQAVLKVNNLEKAVFNKIWKIVILLILLVIGTAILMDLVGVK